MSVQAFISISFTADSVADVESAVNGLTLPEGANVNASVNEQVASGVVEGGTITQPTPPEPPADVAPTNGTTTEEPTP